MTHAAAPVAPASADVLAHVLAQHAGQAGALLPLLHRIQAAIGHVPPDWVPAIAEALNLSRAEVHGVISYYHDFRSSPQPAHRLRVCQAEACQACGSAALTQHCASLLGCDLGGTSGDGQWALEAVYCLGLCAQSPAIEIDGLLHTRVAAHHVQALLHAAHTAQEAI